MKCKECGGDTRTSGLDLMSFGECRKCGERRGYRTGQDTFSCTSSRCNGIVDVDEKVESGWCDVCAKWTTQAVESIHVKQCECSYCDDNIWP
jgi:hypothetical protein